MSDNPFAEPEDSERTVIRPVPGGRRPTPAESLPTAPPPPPPPQVQPTAGEDVERLVMGVNPLVAAAAPLLQLMARLRNTVTQPDPGELRERAIQAMRAFEQHARTSGVPIELLRPAHYALCASLDDVVLNTPWGSTGIWDARSLVSTFHQEVRSGDRFFDLLQQIRQNPGRFLTVLELLYLCMSLGFQGRYRLSPRGPAELDRLREETYALIVRQRQPYEPGLSPHWRGVAAPYRPSRTIVPLWVAASVAAALLALLFVWLSTTLSAASDDLYARMIAVPPVRMPEITRVPTVVPTPQTAAVEPPPPPPVDPICDLLKPEVDRRTVVVQCVWPTPVIRIVDRGMFDSGKADLQPPFVPLLERIGTLLKDQPGKIDVIGYTDNRPIHTIQFPSNFELSAARAATAKAIFDRTVGDPSRITATGRGADDPLNSNSTPDERQENRRIEIVLHRPG